MKIETFRNDKNRTWHVNFELSQEDVMINSLYGDAPQDYMEPTKIIDMLFSMAEEAKNRADRAIINSNLTNREKSVT